jgi:hypothetical protein
VPALGRVARRALSLAPSTAPSSRLAPAQLKETLESAVVKP